MTDFKKNIKLSQEEKVNLVAEYLSLLNTERFSIFFSILITRVMYLKTEIPRHF